MGYPLYGHELSERSSPVATSRGAFIDMKKDFTGKSYVQAELDNPKIKLVGLMFDSRRAAREHDKVYYESIEIGEVTSGSLAPSLGVAVAMAFVDFSFSNIGQILDVDIRGKKFSAEVVALPFYQKGTARG